MNFKFLNKFILLIPFFVAFSVFSQHNHEDKYLRFLELASDSFSENPKIAREYLDSIPSPIKKNVKNHLACYYELKALINDKFNETAKRYQNYTLALKYAELEKNYDAAGAASLELFYNTYLIKKDSSAYKYLDNAKTYYELSENKNGLVEVMQMPAYVEFFSGNFKKSNKLILEQLDNYKSIKDDAYYYMYALFMLSSNYIDLGDIGKSHKYFNILKSLEGNPTLSKSLYQSHLATIQIGLADFYLEKKQVDSTFHYISQSKLLKRAMNDYDLRNYFNLKINYYDLKENHEAKTQYIDSLKVFEHKMLDEIMNSSINIGDSLLNVETELRAEQEKKWHIVKWLIALAVLLILLFVLYTLNKKKTKKVINNFEKSNDEFTYLKSTHEKLKVKVHGLEDYIVEVKKEIKSISSMDSGDAQRKKIKELLKNLHLDSSLLLDKTENHLELVNEFNIDFFTQIKNEYPQLNDSEVIICYYLFVGFKSKEIAVFLNSSTRAVEGKRYRITKKMDLQKSDFTLVEYLNISFKSLKKVES
ncbi:helix-turn-helix transcriptional regulator [Algibacter sp. L3A6]|uniref:helix-turn-helix transcriptional regulator n=1 Tax=Algibacter sp. L3A6 TaxID=2686366 RepID=UPI00131E2379|nr:hypothetical protein [Algibacter sp. L3A6]